MNQKVVTQLPIKELTVDRLVYKRGRYLLMDDIKEALRLKNIEFIIADVATSLKRISGPSLYDFWKENKRNIVADIEHIDLSEYPDEYAYTVSEWTVDADKKIILLEKYH